MSQLENLGTHSSEENNLLSAQDFCEVAEMMVDLIRPSDSKLGRNDIPVLSKAVENKIGINSVELNTIVAVLSSLNPQLTNELEKSLKYYSLLAKSVDETIFSDNPFAQTDVNNSVDLRDTLSHLIADYKEKVVTGGWRDEKWHDSILGINKPAVKSGFFDYCVDIMNRMFKKK